MLYGTQLASTAQILNRAYSLPTSFVFAARHGGAHAEAAANVRGWAERNPSALLARVLRAADAHDGDSGAGVAAPDRRRLPGSDPNLRATGAFVVLGMLLLASSWLCRCQP